jgi:hypothetical protein
MAAISATLTFTPAVPGGAFAATGDTFTALKADAFAKLEAKKAQPTADLAAINAAEAAVNS